MHRTPTLGALRCGPSPSTLISMLIRRAHGSLDPIPHTTPAHPTQVGVVSSTLYLAGTLVLGILGGVLYVVVLLVLVLVAWSSVYQWLGKVVFSLFNLVVRPPADALRLRQRRKVAPESLSRSPTGRREAHNR